ncbi:MAG: maleylacetoacetate isomerase [Hyphomicrobiales bacterium]
MKLYGYFRSSAAFRVRIALNLKGLTVEHVPVHLVRNGGEQKHKPFRLLNPQMLVPALELDDGSVLTQSLAIIEYLETVWPHPRVIPADPIQAARARAVAHAVACDIHPLNNLRVLNYLKGELGAQKEAVEAWYKHWIEQGFDAIERLIQAGPFCFGNTATIADICLIPQIFNARRYKMDIPRFPKIARVEAHCLDMPAFAAAVPDRQPDAE